MTIKEAIIRVLEQEKKSYSYLEVLNQINKLKLIDWGNAKTPADTIGAQLGDFIRKNDSRVKRVKGPKGFEYYLAKYERDIEVVNDIESSLRSIKKKSFLERDLHKLLSSYLQSQDIMCKTIFHEKSLNSKDDYQKWIHPDMIGIKFLNLKNKMSNSLMKIMNKADSFDLISYEIKKEIKSDYDLKKYFFQAVSNSSWANYGYLVALDINPSLKDEMERLNQSFGIGIIELNSYPYESQTLFPSKYSEVDFKTIDKLCEVNKDFEKFISLTEMILVASDKYYSASKKEFSDFCDDYFESEAEISIYCNEKNIPSSEELCTN